MERECVVPVCRFLNKFVAVELLYIDLEGCVDIPGIFPVFEVEREGIGDGSRT